MSLEVDGRPRSVPILHPREEESLKYLNGQSTYGDPSNAQDPYRVGGNVEEHEQPQKHSKAKDLGQGGRLRLRLGVHVPLGLLIRSCLRAGGCGNRCGGFHCCKKREAVRHVACQRKHKLL